MGTWHSQHLVYPTEQLKPACMKDKEEMWIQSLESETDIYLFIPHTTMAGY